MSLPPGSPHPRYAPSLAITVPHHSHYCLFIELAPLPDSELPGSVNGPYSSQTPWRVRRLAWRGPREMHVRWRNPSPSPLLGPKSSLVGLCLSLPLPQGSRYTKLRCVRNASGTMAFSVIGARRRQSREGGKSLPSPIYSKVLFSKCMVQAESSRPQKTNTRAGRAQPPTLQVSLGRAPHPST